MLQHFPTWMNNTNYAFLHLSPAQWTCLPIAIVIAYAAGWLLQIVIVAISRIVVRRTDMTWDNDLIEELPRPLRFALTLLIFSQLLAAIELDAEAGSFLYSLLACGMVFIIAWFLLRSLGVFTHASEDYFSKGLEGTAQARAIHTQVSVVRTILRFIIMVAAVAIALMQFEVARTLGMSLLASAGVATFAVGFAARSTFAAIFAGIQVAFTQTIKIGDVVVVEDEWGRIEDIKLTHVVVKIWDLRRLILPVTYFTEKPFENWTTNSTEVLGTVYLHTDYSVAIDDVRAELKSILKDTELWDGETSGAIITNLTQTGAEVRLLVSAKDSSNLWDLRCLVREKMLAWLQQRGEVILPVNRVRATNSINGNHQQNSIATSSASVAATDINK